MRQILTSFLVILGTAALVEVAFALLSHRSPRLDTHWLQVVIIAFAASATLKLLRITR